MDWAARHASAAGFVGVTVACEPTGHRWWVLGQLAADRGMPFVCVQPMISSWSRRAEDLTFDKTDETWGRLRHLGTRRDQLIVTMTSQVQQMRSLLEYVWPAALDTAKQPFRSRTWLAALTALPGPTPCRYAGNDDKS